MPNISFDRVKTTSTNVHLINQTADGLVDATVDSQHCKALQGISKYTQTGQAKVAE